MVHTYMTVRLTVIRPVQNYLILDFIIMHIAMSYVRWNHLLMPKDTFTYRDVLCTMEPFANVKRYVHN